MHPTHPKPCLPCPDCQTAQILLHNEVGWSWLCQLPCLSVSQPRQSGVLRVFGILKKAFLSYHLLPAGYKMFSVKGSAAGESTMSSSLWKGSARLLIPAPKCSAHIKLNRQQWVHIRLSFSFQPPWSTEKPQGGLSSTTVLCSLQTQFWTVERVHTQPNPSPFSSLSKQSQKNSSHSCVPAFISLHMVPASNMN